MTSLKGFAYTQLLCISRLMIITKQSYNDVKLSALKSHAVLSNYPLWQIISYFSIFTVALLWWPWIHLPQTLCRRFSLCEFGTTSYLCSNSIWISNALSYLSTLLLSQEDCKWLMSPTNKFIALEYKYPLWHQNNSLAELPVIIVSRDRKTVRI